MPGSNLGIDGGLADFHMRIKTRCSGVFKKEKKRREKGKELDGVGRRGQNAMPPPPPSFFNNTWDPFQFMTKVLYFFVLGS